MTSSDDYDAVNDPLIDRETGVFYNRFGITNADELEAAEAAAVAIRTYELRQSPLQGKFDLEHLQAIHKHLFQDVYEWAGQLRKLDISKGSTRFANHLHLATAMNKITAQLIDDDHLLGLEPAALADKCAYYMAELNALHPFREGNGRTQREFINHLCANCGYTVAWENAQPDELLKRTIIAHMDSDKPLAELIGQNLKPRR